MYLFNGPLSRLLITTMAALIALALVLIKHQLAGADAGFAVQPERETHDTAAHVEER